MATTTNYGWTTPDDTALVKDGASAIRTLGSSVDTTTKNLNPSTTLGDIEYRSSTANTNTRLGIGTSGQALTVVAGAPSWAASPTSVLTTTGDSLYASAANTLARLGIGTAGQVLTVNSGATAPEWATVAGGGMTLLSTTTLSGATTTISSISGSYNTLFAIVSGVTNATNPEQFRVAPNGSTTTSFNFRVSDPVNGTWTNQNASYMALSTSGGEAPDRTSANNAISFTINNYTSTTAHKPFQVYGYYNVNNSATDQGFANFGAIQTTSAITSLVFSSAGGNLSTGTVLLYGVK